MIIYVFFSSLPTWKLATKKIALSPILWLVEPKYTNQTLSTLYLDYFIVIGDLWTLDLLRDLCRLTSLLIGLCTCPTHSTLTKNIQYEHPLKTTIQ